MNFSKKNLFYLASLILLLLETIHPLSAEENSPKICLTMIVKNESAIMRRCLEQAAPIVDAICICDTGSSDNTVEIIESFLQEKKIPGKVYHHTWQNFGHNRTLSASAAVEFLSENGSLLNSWYLLLLDADMLIKKEKEFSKKDLCADVYMVKQVNGDMAYENVRLIKASLPWECIGVTHEYWNSPEAKSTKRISTLWIDDKNDGGCKSDKFERDVRLLTEGLQKEPQNARYMFYLAQSYMCLQKFDEAISWYKERAKIPEFFEEAWYAKYMIGDCYKRKDNFEEALKWYLDAYAMNPARAEPLVRIADYYMGKQLYSLAHLFAKQASSIPYPKDQALFIEKSNYLYLPDQMLSIAGYYTAFGKKDGQEATDRLILKKETPRSNFQLAYANMEFYTKPLEGMKKIPLTINFPETIPGSSITYRPCNPSIQKTEDGYTVILRTVNFGLGKTEYFPLNPDEKIFNTKNFLLKLSKDFSILSSKEIVENTPREKFCTRPVTGLEDCRLFSLVSEKSPEYCTCTTVDTDPSGLPQISLLRFHENDTHIDVTRVLPLEKMNPELCEKNWLPFMKDGKMHVIYSYDPFIVYAIDTETGKIKKVLKYTPKGNFSNFRGSAGPVPFNQGYLVIVHEVSRYLPGQRRNYLHRFVYLNKDFKICKVSHPFTLCHLGTEYCCGMAVDHEDKQIILGFGIEDKEAYLGCIDKKTIESMLFEQS